MKEFLKRIFNINNEEDLMGLMEKIQGALVGLAIAGFFYILISTEKNDKLLVVSLGLIFLAWIIPKIVKLFI